MIPVATTDEKESMNLEKSKEGHIGGKWRDIYAIIL